MSDETQMSVHVEAPSVPAAEPPVPAGNQPQAVSDDPATIAFEALREEMALVRRAVSGLTAERTASAIPDYSETLGKILHSNAITSKNMRILAELPALRLTPEIIGHQIDDAAQASRRADHAILEEARAALHKAAQELSAHQRSARTAEDRRRRLFAAGTGGILAGILLWGLLSGPIVRAAPASWHWPERMAANILAMDEQTAGAHLIATASPVLWRDILLGNRIVNTNRETLKACQNGKAKTSKRCMIAPP